MKWIYCRVWIRVLFNLPLYIISYITKFCLDRVDLVWFIILVLSVFTDSLTSFILVFKLIYVSLTAILDQIMTAICWHMPLFVLTYYKVNLSDKTDLHLFLLLHILEPGWRGGGANLSSCFRPFVSWNSW